MKCGVEHGNLGQTGEKVPCGLDPDEVGGILRCDVLANGVVEAAKKTGIKVPVVVRMEGTNVAEGRKILAESGLNLITAADLKEAAQKIAEVVQ